MVVRSTVAVVESVPSPWVLVGIGLIVGVLVGALFTVVIYGFARGAAVRRARRFDRWRSVPKPSPGPAQPWAAEPRLRHGPRAGGGINDYLYGQRNRPDFNPSPGPRDW